jgi:predicted kinase
MGKVVLLGGAYGSGKSSLAQELKQFYGSNCCQVIDFDDLTRGYRPQLTGWEDYKDHLRHVVIPTMVGDSLTSGRTFVVVAATFYKRSSRMIMTEQLSQVADVYGFFFMLPLLGTVRRVRQNRPADSDHDVNRATINSHQTKFIRRLEQEGLGDVMLPRDPCRIPPEWRALLARANRSTTATPLDYACSARWIALVDPIAAPDIAALLKEARHPCDIRQRLG